MRRLIPWLLVIALLWSAPVARAAGEPVDPAPYATLVQQQYIAMAEHSWSQFQATLDPRDRFLEMRAQSYFDTAENRRQGAVFKHELLRVWRTNGRVSGHVLGTYVDPQGQVWEDLLQASFREVNGRLVMSDLLLTQPEYTLENYQLKVYLETDRSTIRGQMTAQLQPVAPPRQWIHLRLGEEFTPSLLLLGGKRVEWERDGSYLAIRVPEQYAGLRLDLKYEGKIDRTYDGITTDEVGPDGSYLRAWIDWYPSVDGKADGEVRFHYPGGMELVSPGRRLSSDRTGTTWIDHWQVDEPTRLIFTVRKYAVQREAYKGIDIAIYTDEANQGHLPLYLDQLKRSLDTLTELLGPFPYKHLTLAEVSQSFLGGHAGQSLILITPRSTWHADEWQEVITHEVAHQWFGNHLQDESIGGPYLSEGFSSYVAALYTERRYGEQAFANTMAWYEEEYRNETEDVNGEKSLLYVESDDDGYYGIAYDKGAWFLHTMRSYAGDEAFFRALSRYAREYAGQTVSPSHFLLLLSEEVGEDLSTWAFDWIEEPVRPDYAILESAQQKQGGTWNTEVTVKNLGTGDLPHLPVVAYTREGSVTKTLPINGETKLWFTTPDPVLEVVIDPDARFLDVDRENNTHYWEAKQLSEEPSANVTPAGTAPAKPAPVTTSPPAAAANAEAEATGDTWSWVIVAVLAALLLGFRGRWLRNWVWANWYGEPPGSTPPAEE